MSHPINGGPHNECYGQTDLLVAAVDLTSGGSHRGGNGSKETEMRLDPMTTCGDGAQWSVANFFVFVSGTTIIHENLVAAFEYPNWIVAPTEFSNDVLFLYFTMFMDYDGEI